MTVSTPLGLDPIGILHDIQIATAGEIPLPFLDFIDTRVRRGIEYSVGICLIHQLGRRTGYE